MPEKLFVTKKEFVEIKSLDLHCQDDTAYLDELKRVIGGFEIAHCAHDVVVVDKVTQRTSYS